MKSTFIEIAVLCVLSVFIWGCATKEEQKKDSSTAKQSEGASPEEPKKAATTETPNKGASAKKPKRVAATEKPKKDDSSIEPGLSISGTWATDGTGAGGIRVFIQERNLMTGHFDEKRGRYSGTVDGKKLTGKFWWNDDPSETTTFEKTPLGQRGEFEVMFSLDGNSFTGRTRYDEGKWVSWNGIKMSGGAKVSGTWATDGTGAGGIRTFVQVGNRMTGHFDEKRGRYSGVVNGKILTGKFWWNDDPSETTTFEKTPLGQRGEFEVTFSLNGNSFTGRTRYEGGKWASWNGVKESRSNISGTWATDGTGAGGIRTFLREGNRMTGHFDENRGQYSGSVDGKRLTGKFWWNDEFSDTKTYDKTPLGQRGQFEVTFSMDGNSFTGRTRYDEGKWVSWNGTRTER